DVLEGLHAAHELTDRGGTLLKLVHRDISPHNILVGIDGVARITDFGIAFAEARLTSTRRGQLKGKMPYMAPEQLEGLAIDRRVDIYAAGCVLWEMLTGKRLFVADNEAALACQVLAGPTCSPREVCPDVPEPLDAACMQALGKIGARFTTAAAFAEAIDAAASQAQLNTARPRVVAALIEGIGLRVSADMLEDELDDTDAPPPTEPTAKRSEPVPPSIGTATIDGSEGPASEDLPAAVRPVAVGAGSSSFRTPDPVDDDSTEVIATDGNLSDRSPESEEPEQLGERTSMAASLSTLPGIRRPAAMSNAIVAAIMASLVTAIVVWLAVRTPEPGEETTAEAVETTQPAASSAAGATPPIAASAGDLDAPATTASALAAASASPAGLPATSPGPATSRSTAGPWPPGGRSPITGTGKGATAAPGLVRPTGPAPSSTTFHPPSL
ncbi:MAG: protein kinase, partial [Deltaproteobacteria bacterium]|nr:protein kinase [Deltaproteobacteria bacterium]